MMLAAILDSKWRTSKNVYTVPTFLYLLQQLKIMLNLYYCETHHPRIFLRFFDVVTRIINMVEWLNIVQK